MSQARGNQVMRLNDSLLMVTMQRPEPHNTGVGIKDRRQKVNGIILLVDMIYFNFLEAKYRTTVGASGVFSA